MTHELTKEQEQQPELERRQLELERLYLRNREHIRDAALENPKLLAPDADHIVDDLVRHLSAYDGQTTDNAFLEWAGTVARSAADRICRFNVILQNHQGNIRRGIRSALPAGNYYDDRQALTADCFQEIVAYVLANLDDLDLPGQSADVLAARLFALARWHTLGYHTLKLKRRKAALENHLLVGGVIQECEVLSSEEIAEMRTAEDDEYHAPVDYHKAIRASRQAAADDARRSMDSGRMLCPSGCELQPVSSVYHDGTSRLACGRARSAQITAAV